MIHASPHFLLMIQYLPTRSTVFRLIETLAIGIASAGVFWWLALPGGLISGAMIAVGAAAVAGRPLALPLPVAHAILMTLGVSLGSMVSPQMLKDISNYPITIAVLALSTFGATCNAFTAGIAPPPCSPAAPAPYRKSFYWPPNERPMSPALPWFKPSG